MNDIKGYYFNLLDDDESDKVLFKETSNKLYHQYRYC